MAWRIWVAVCVILGMFTLWAVPAHAQEVPPLPHAFFGNLTINGSPASIGTNVEARGTGVTPGIVNNPFTTTAQGKYGGPDLLDPKLIVQGNIASDTPIRFYVNGVDTGQTYPFRSGETKRFDLSITVTTAAVPAVTTSAATSVTATSATLTGHLLDLGAASSVTVSFQWGTTTNYGNETTAQTMTAAGQFSITVSGLMPGTAYYFVAKAVSGSTVSRGLSGSFTTSASSQSAPAGGGQTPPASSSGQTLLAGKISSQGIITQSVTAESGDGVCRLTIDGGTKALGKEGNPLPQVTMTPVPQPPPPPNGSNIIGMTYDFGPDGAAFSPPVALRYVYNPSSIPTGVNEKELVIAYYDNSAANWVRLQSTVDTVTKTITALVSHFTSFAILGYGAPAASAPAAFSLSSLAISPAEAKIGETVSIRITVANTGSQSGNYKVVLKVGGQVEATSEVTVAAGATKEVSFSTVKSVPATYSVDVGGLAGSFVVREAASAAATFSLSSLAISPAEAKVGEKVSIRISVANTSSQSGNYKVVLMVGGQVEATSEVTVAAGATKEVSFSTVKDVPGTYSVDVSGLTGSFVVKAPTVSAASPRLTPTPSSAPPRSQARFSDWVLNSAIIGFVLLLAAVVLLVVKRRRY